MKILLIHSDYMEYEVTEKTGLAEDIEDSLKNGRMEEALTVFATIEKEDEGKEDEVIERGAEEIAGVAGKLGVKSIMIYPYAHLSSSLAGKDTALKVLKGLEAALSEHFTVHRSPFGWYKSFKISCKGHPLSELSREIRAGEKKKTREDVVAKITSEFVVLTPEGEEIPLNFESKSSLKFLKQYPSLKKAVYFEHMKGVANQEPPSIKAMQRLELIDYEPASDSGHFRYYPKGNMIFKLLEKWAGQIAHERLDAVEIDTPLLYDWSLPDIRGQTESFHERHYVVTTPEKREFVLRFAGDFGLFRMMSDATISYKNLPVRVYEFSKSFRFEKRGELSGLRRLRAFHMPDLHSFSRDVEHGWEEYMAIYREFSDLANASGIEYAVVFRVVREFYDRYRDKIVELLRHSGRPAMIEILSDRKHYWVVKHEFQGIDAVGGTFQLSTVQLDIEDAERYGIVYTDADGKQKGCIICHSSIGSIERWIFALMEEALKKEKPAFPLWLAPTQVRLIPLNDDFAADCRKIADSLPGVRTDIDDRDEKVGKKIRQAEREWINMIVVYGQKEKDSGKLPVRMRDGHIEEMIVEELREAIRRGTEGYPYEPLPLPRMLSKRIVFRG